MSRSKKGAGQVQFDVPELGGNGMLAYWTKLYLVPPWSHAELGTLQLKVKNNLVLLILSTLAADAAGQRHRK
jgi:hypothetical protein